MSIFTRLNYVSRLSKECLFSQQCMMSSYFSITRLRQGKSSKEKEKELGVPEPPPLEVPHCRRDIRCPPKKMTLVANLLLRPFAEYRPLFSTKVARMPIQEALSQLEFNNKSAAAVVKEVLEEAQEVAVKKYGVEDKNNLYVDQSHVGRGQHLKRIKFHGRGRFGKMKRYYCHYFCVLKEGEPPGKNISRNRTRYLSELERKLKHPKTIKNSLAWW